MSSRFREALTVATDDTERIYKSVPFEFLGDEPTVEQLVYQALGAASVCWEGVPHGVFLSERCKQIGEELIKELKKRGLNDE